MAKFQLKKLCSKERIGRLTIGLLILFLMVFLLFWQPIIGIFALFLGFYLVITALLGSCLLYAIWKE